MTAKPNESQNSTASKWYLNVGGRAKGPFNAQEVQGFLAQGKVKGHDLVFREGAKEWKKLFEWEDFASVFADESEDTGFTNVDEVSEINSEDSPPPHPEPVVLPKWILLVRDENDKDVRFKQRGPYTEDEIKKMILNDQVKLNDHVWQKGMAKWKPIFEVPEFHARSLNENSENRKELVAVDVMPRLNVVVVKKQEPEPVSIEPVSTESAVARFESAAAPAGAATSATFFSKGNQVELVSPVEDEQDVDVTDPGVQVIPPEEGAEATVLRSRPNKNRDVEAVQSSKPAFNLTKPFTPPPIAPPAMAAPPTAPPLMAPLSATALFDSEENEPATAAEDEIVKVPLKKSNRVPKEPLPKMEEVLIQKGPGFWSKVAPVMYLGMIALVGVGIWATVKTQAPFPKSQIVVNEPTASLESQDVASTSVNNSDPAANNSNTYIELPSDEPPIKELTEKPSSPPAIEAQVPKRKIEPLPKKIVASTSPQPPPNPTQDNDEDTKPPVSEPKQTSFRINTKKAQLEIVGPFKKGELLKFRIEGKPGQILDLPAVTQKVEVRATKDYIHKLSLTELRIPRGLYKINFQSNLSKLTKAITFSSDADNLQSLLAGQKKKLVFDQQSERKKLIKVTHDLVSLVSKIESEPADQVLVKRILKDLEERVPAEVRLTKTNRFELIYSSYWERLSLQWEKANQQLKDSNRGPASLAEFVRIRKALSQIETDVKNESIYSSQN